MALFFVVAGANHFRQPSSYLAILPPYLPYPRALVYLSGALEIVGGAGVLAGATRRAAGFLLIAVLVAVFPANVHMAVAGTQPPGWNLPGWFLWTRLPLQLLFIGIVWWVAVRCRPEGS